MYSLPTPPTTPSEVSIRIADWIELNLLTGEEPLLSVDTVANAIAEVPPDDSASGEHRQEYSTNPENLEGTDYRDGYWQMAEADAEAAFEVLRVRASEFCKRYPLDVNLATVQASPDFDSLDIARFLTLLRSRHLYHGALEDDGDIAGALFEELLPHALRCYIGSSAGRALRFGVAGGSRGDCLPLETDAALKDLGRRMNETKGSLELRSVGEDLGGDAIAWKPLGDSRPGQLVIIGQSTISEHKWIGKQPSPKWKSHRLIRFLSLPVSAVAFVETLSLYSRSYFDGLGGQFSSIPLDRLRLLYFTRDADIPSCLRKRMGEWCKSMCARLAQ